MVCVTCVCLSYVLWCHLDNAKQGCNVYWKMGVLAKQINARHMHRHWLDHKNVQGKKMTRDVVIQIVFRWFYFWYLLLAIIGPNIKWRVGCPGKASKQSSTFASVHSPKPKWLTCFSYLLNKLKKFFHLPSYSNSEEECSINHEPLSPRPGNRWHFCAPDRHKMAWK